MKLHSTHSQKLSRKNWEKIAADEFAAMDSDAQASWKELRERAN